MRLARLALVVIVVLVLAGLGVREWQGSLVAGHARYRFNMAWIVPESGVSFVSFDPVERTVMIIPFPSDLAIKSRTSGEYAISALYKLGQYQDKGGSFARQKIQGFMRVPIPGYLVGSGSITRALLATLWGDSESNLSIFDTLVLVSHLSRYRPRVVSTEELIRAGVVEGKTYHSDRLQAFVGERLFDWEIATEGVSVAILNESGIDGLGGDMADFLDNLGLDVVSVRSGETSDLQESSWMVGDSGKADELGYIFEGLFGFPKPQVGNPDQEYRAEILIRVGSDARELF